MVKKQDKKFRPSLLPKQSKLSLTTVQRLGIIITGIFLILFFGPFIVHSTQYILAGQKASQARKSSEPSYDNDRSKRIAALQQAGVIAAPSPAYSSKLDACYVTHDDAGWTARNWHQDCYIRYTDLFATTLSRSEVEQKLQAARQTSDIFGDLNIYKPGTCDTLYEKDYEPSLIYLDWSFAEKDGDFRCRLPKPTQDISTVHGPILLDNELMTKITRTYDPSSVDKTKKYIFMQSDNYYYHEDLGCGMGFLCPSPRSHPATGF